MQIPKDKILELVQQQGNADQAAQAPITAVACRA